MREGEREKVKKERGREGRRKEGGQGRGACQPPASSNYQCEWSVAAGAIGLIRALLKETRPCPPVPLGGCWSSIPNQHQPAFFPKPKHTHLTGGKHSRHSGSLITGEPWHSGTRYFCIKMPCLISMSDWHPPSSSRSQKAKTGERHVLLWMFKGWFELEEGPFLIEHPMRRNIHEKHC